MSQKFLSDVTLSTVTGGSMLKLDANGKIVAAVDGTDYISTSASSLWSTASGGIFYSDDVRVGTYQSDVAPDAKLHVYDYQTTTPKLLIEDGNTGDASMEFKISTQSFTMGIDNSDSDKFVIAASGGLGTSNVLEIATSGLSAFQNSVLVKGSLFINNQEQIQQGATEKIASFQNLGTERGYFEVTDTGKGYFYADGFKTGATTVGFLKSDGSVDTGSFFSGNYSDLSGTPTLGTMAAANTNDYKTSDEVETYVAGELVYTNISGTPTLGTAAAADTTDFATAAQGALADSALQSLPSHNHDGRYYTETEADSRFAQNGNNLVPINATDSHYQLFTEEVVLATVNTYRGLAFPNGGKNFVFEVSIKGTNGANHQGIFWGLDTLATIYNNGEAGYKLTHQAEGAFHIRDIASNANQATSQDVMYAPNDGLYHRYKIISYVDPSNSNKAFFKVYVDGNLIFNAPQFAAPPQTPTYFGFINYTGEATFSNWNVREITGEAELALLYGDGVFQPAGNYLTSLPAHHHDARYYTETEMDTFLAGKLSTSGGVLSGAINVLYTDSPTGTGWDKNLFIGTSDDLGLAGAFPTYVPSGSYGFFSHANSDGVFIGSVPTAAGSNNYYATIAWGDDSTEYLQFLYKGTQVAYLETSGNLYIDGSFYSGTSKIATETFASGEAQAVQDNLDTVVGSLGSNAYTSYTDHTGLYDTVGSAAAEAGAVQDNLDSLAGSLGNAAFTSASDYATASHNHDSDYINVGGDTMTGILKLNAGVTNNNWSTFTHLEGAYSVNNPSGTGGAIRIELPTAEYLTNTMMTMTVKVYEYSTGKSFTLFLGGYNYSNGVWYNTFASMVGDNERGDVPVKFGQDGTRNIIWIGNPDWSWSYPNVWVTDFQSGHTQGQDWNDGWRIVFDQEEAVNVTASQTAHKQITTGNIGGYGYLTTSSASSTYLPLAGGTMTGALSFNGNANHIVIGHTSNNTGNILFKQDGTTYKDIDFSAYDGQIGFYEASGGSGWIWRFGVTGTNKNKLWHNGFNGYLIDANGDYNGTWQGYSPSSFATASHNHDDRYYTESESDTRFLNTSGDTVTGLMTFSAGIDYEYAFYQGYAWYKRFYVRSVGLTGSAIANSWVLLGIVRNENTYERTDVKFRIRGYDDVSSGTEIIQLRVENHSTAQEIHQLYWYADDATPNLFREVKSVIAQADGLANTYFLWVKMAGDWTDTFTVEAEVFNSHSRPFEFDDVTVIPEGGAPEVPVSDITKTERVWYTSNASIHTNGGRLATESFVTGQGYLTSVPSSYATTSYVDTAVSNLVDSAPSALNTLNELAAALGDDANFSTTVTNSLAAKLPLSGGTMTGDLQWDTSAAPTNTHAKITFGQSPNPDGSLNGMAQVADYGADGYGLLLHVGYGESDNGGIKITDDGVIVWGASDENVFTVIDEDSRTERFRIDNSGNITASGTLTASGYNKSNWDTAYGWGNHASAGYASAGYLTNSAGAKLEIQDAVDGGTEKGIYMWQTSDPNWVIYMAQAGAGKSAAGGNAVEGLDGTTGHAIRFRVNNNAEQSGFIWENKAEEALMQLNGGTKNLYVAGRVYTGGGNSGQWDTAVSWGNHADAGYLTSATAATTYQPLGNYFTDGDTVLNMANNDGLVYNDTNNTMYIKKDGTNYAIIDSGGGTMSGQLTASGGINMGNTNITNVNHITINDAGYGEGVQWSNWMIYDSPDDLSNQAGNFQISSIADPTIRVTVDPSGNLYPSRDRLHALGLETNRWQIVFCEILDSAGQHEKNLQNPEGEKSVGEYETGTVLVWKGGKNVPCTTAADHMRMGIAVNGIDSPLIQGAEPVLVTGAVNEGDYLVTSSKKEGHAEAISPEFMRQHNLFDCVLGKALESAEGESHLVKTWINI